MSTSFNFRDIKILKPITIVALLYSVLMFFKYIISLSGLFFEPENPLIPKYLPYYAAFPSYFIVPFFGFIIFLCIRILKAKHYDFRIVYALFILVVLFFIFQWSVHEFLMSFNPYAS